MTAFDDHTALRSRFSAALSSLYAAEVPAYQVLVDECRDINETVVDREGRSAQNLGSIERVTAERHGAIRVGTPRELAEVARVFGAVGMLPTGFYDLREAKPNPIPVVSTAFRPAGADELSANPFRVFTSMLVPQDRRFFDADLNERLDNFLGSRQLFNDRLMELADRSIEEGGLLRGDADEFLELATQSFALSNEPVDRAWYAELEAVSSVAADIGGVSSTHINHLTPRVLDIDGLYVGMQRRGIEMIDAIQGPPKWRGPDVLLRQTSFRALAEARRFRDADGRIKEGHLRVRFGEVEARGVALTPAGRDLYDRMLGEVDRRQANGPDASRAEVARDVWEEMLPDSDEALASEGLAYYGVRVTRPSDLRRESMTVAEALQHDLVELRPIVYEDFLPRSAAGIFASNLTGDGSFDDTSSGSTIDAGWLADVIDHEIRDPYALYETQAAESLQTAAAELGVGRLHH